MSKTISIHIHFIPRSSIYLIHILFKSDIDTWGLVSFMQIMIFNVHTYGHIEYIKYNLSNFISIKY